MFQIPYIGINHIIEDTLKKWKQIKLVNTALQRTMNTVCCLKTHTEL